MYKKYFKRPLDILMALCGIIVLSPVMLVTAILVKTKLGSPVIFCQERPGKDEKIFKMYKFRSMTDERDENGELLSDTIRLTKFGKLLRSTSLDELPELFNILKGDMSVVGPRPQLVRDLVFMNEEQRRRQEIRQGLTGLAQVKGRNNISWEKKFEFDLEYISRITFYGDIKIILLTIVNVVRRKDIQTEGMDTALDFGDYLLLNNIVSEADYLDTQEQALNIIRCEIREGVH